jgi:rhodanese-related sulfurtransferase
MGWRGLVVAVLLVTIACLPVALRAEMSDKQKKAAVYAMYADYRSDFPQVPDMHPREAMDLMAEGRVVFVDTREPEEMAVSTLPGALSRDQFLQQASRYADRQVVVYCTISYRSGLFAREMAQRGIALTNLQGGVLAWVLEGGPVVDTDGETTRRVHVFGDRWNLAPRGYETVVFPLWKRWF